VVLRHLSRILGGDLVVCGILRRRHLRDPLLLFCNGRDARNLDRRSIQLWGPLLIYQKVGDTDSHYPLPITGPSRLFTTLPHYLGLHRTKHRYMVCAHTPTRTCIYAPQSFYQNFLVKPECWYGVCQAHDSGHVWEESGDCWRLASGVLARICALPRISRSAPLDD
jgi:hypothetical protein